MGGNRRRLGCRGWPLLVGPVWGSHSSLLMQTLPRCGISHGSSRLVLVLLISRRGSQNAPQGRASRDQGHVNSEGQDRRGTGRPVIRVGLGPGRVGVDVLGGAGQCPQSFLLHTSGGAPPSSPARQKPKLGVSRTEGGQLTGGPQGHLPSV